MRLIVVFFLLAVTALAADDPPKVIRTDYYEVTGSNVATLLASMKAQRPHTNNAFTEWYIDWNYEFLSQPGECVLRGFDLRVQIRYTLPKWVAAQRADPALKAEWKRFLSATMRHERSHADFGLAAAKEMTRVAKAATWQAESRAALRAKLDAECERILKDFTAREVLYDEKTDHGRTQGARCDASSVGASWL